MNENSIVTVTMTPDKETKNTIKFREVKTQLQDVIGVLYIPKQTLEKMGHKDIMDIKVTIELVEK